MENEGKCPSIENVIVIALLNTYIVFTIRSKFPYWPTLKTKYLAINRNSEQSF